MVKQKWLENENKKKFHPLTHMKTILTMIFFPPTQMKTTQFHPNENLKNENEIFFDNVKKNFSLCYTNEKNTFYENESN